VHISHVCSKCDPYIRVARGEYEEREGKNLAIMYVKSRATVSTHRHSSLLPWSMWERGAGHVEVIAGVEVQDSLVDPRTPRACARPSPHRSFLLLLSQKEWHVEPHGAKARRQSFASVGTLKPKPSYPPPAPVNMHHYVRRCAAPTNAHACIHDDTRTRAPSRDGRAVTWRDIQSSCLFLKIRRGGGGREGTRTGASTARR
jgi:hypothetical protein